MKKVNFEKYQKTKHLKLPSMQKVNKHIALILNMSNDMGFSTMWYVRYAQSDQSLCKSLEHSMTVKLLTEQFLGFLSFKGGCTGLSESTFVKMPHCWKSHVTAPMSNQPRTLYHGPFIE